MNLALRRIWHLRRAYQLASLSCSPRGRLRLLASAAALAAREAAGSRGTTHLRLDLGGLGSVAVQDFSELLVTWEVLVGGVYDVPELPEDADVIVDLGCNVGASMMWFRDRYPSARIVGYEADPVTAELARRNTAHLQNIEVHAAAVAAQDGETAFHRIAGRSWASGTDVDGGSTVTVPAVSLETVIRHAGGAIDILKLNVEGAEHPMLAAARDLDRIALILGQYHPAAGVSWETLRRSLEGLELRPARAPDDEGRAFVAIRPPCSAFATQRVGRERSP